MVAMALPPTPAINLPELPPPLRHLSPYIQRALELRSKDPIMSYWCKYLALLRMTGFIVTRILQASTLPQSKELQRKVVRNAGHSFLL
jgi:hypothetical protein